MGLLKKAAAKAEGTKTTKAKKQTLWLTNTQEAKAVDDAIDKLFALESERKRIDAQQTPLKALVKRYADEQFVQTYVSQQTMPDTPMILQSANGSKTTYVVQDRSGQYKVSDEQKEDLATLFGEDVVETLVFEEHSFGLNRDVLAVDGVSDIVEKKLEEAIAEIVAAGLLSQESAEALVTADVKTAFRPNVIQRLFDKAGRDVQRFKQALEIAGSSVVRYVKL